jgi:hypothetical protein
MSSSSVETAVTIVPMSKRERERERGAIVSLTFALRVGEGSARFLRLRLLVVLGGERVTDERFERVGHARRLRRNERRHHLARLVWLLPSLALLLCEEGFAGLLLRRSAAISREGLLLRRHRTSSSSCLRRL